MFRGFLPHPNLHLTHPRRGLLVDTDRSTLVVEGSMVVETLPFSG